MALLSKIRQVLACLLIVGFPQICSALGVDPDAQAITIALTEEPPNLDSALTEDQVSAFVLRTTQEGLVRVDARGQLQPGIAESWRITDDGAEFTLREGARWSDGKPITARDFVFAWRRLVDPATGASGSLFLSFVLKNADDIVKGVLPPAALGVEAIDDRTLRVITSRYIPYLLEVLAQSPFLPLREDVIARYGSTYAAEFDHMVFSGPFSLTAWTHGASLTFSSNEHYWNRNDVNLRAIRVGYITNDMRALLNLYNSGELATLSLNNTVIEDAAKAGHRIQQRLTNCFSQVTLNLREGRPTANKDLRKALLYSFDPQTYVNRVIASPGVRPLYGMYTSSTKGRERSFVQEYTSPYEGADLVRAKAHMEKARDQLGNSPELVLLSRQGNEKQDEYLQSLFKQTLGLTVKIDRQSFKQAIERLIAGEFDLAFSGFCNGGIYDPYLTAYTFISTNPFNDGRFTNGRYDELFELAKLERDNARRMHAFAEMQNILLEEAAVLPTHETADVFVTDRRVQGLVYGPVRNFNWGRIRQ